MGARRLTVAACAFAAMVTAVIAAVPTSRLAIVSPELRAALEASQALIAVLAAYLVYGRVRRSGMRNDLLVVFTLALSGTTNLFFIALPSGSDDALTFQTWGRLLTRVIGSAALAWAAVGPDRPLRVPERAGINVVIAFDAALAASAVVVAALLDVLPEGIEVLVTSNGLAEPVLWGHPATLVTELVVVTLYLVAAFGFANRAEPTRDPLLTSLAAGSALAAFSWLLFSAFPSIFSDVVHVGDALRLAFYLVLLLGAEREIQRWWGRVAHAAAMDERRRLARDLHDGMAQEMAFVSRTARLLARDQAPPGSVEMLAGAAERALDEARRAISALTTGDDESIGLAIAHAAEEMAGRVGVAIEVSVDDEVDVDARTREAVLRIVRESVTNAARHGGAAHVQVVLDGRRVLRIEDDGCGFDVDEAAGKGRFGLVSMRERAEGLGARFRISSVPGTGTKVEVVLP